MSRGFKAFHPFVLLIFYTLAITFIMYYQELIALTFIAIAIVLMNLLFDKGVQLRKWLKPLIIMGVFIIILTPVFNHIGNTVLFYLFHWAITLDAILQGVVFALTLVNIISLFVTFNIILTNEKLLFLFGKWFPKWALLTMLSIRFVPLLKDRLTEIEEVQRFKNSTIKNTSFKRKIQNGMAQIQTLLSWSLEESIQTADSMDARGYGAGKRSKYHRYRLKLKDWILLTVFTVITSLFVLFLNGIDLIPINILIAFIFIIPIYVEGKEVIKWQFYLSKI